MAANIRPAHGAPGNPCPVCSAAAAVAARKAGNSRPRRIYCNQLRSAMSIERARRIIAELTGLEMPGTVRPDPAGKPDPGAGREW